MRQVVNGVEYTPVGDGGVLLKFGDAIEEKTNQRVREMMDRINQKNMRGVIDMIPSFTSLLILYDMKIIKYGKLMKILQNMMVDLQMKKEVQRVVHKIPVCYGGEYGMDIAFVAEHAQLSVEEVIKKHSEREYLIYMLGFLPGFAYLGGMNEQLFTPRLQSPRTKIPAGSVGIGGEQTGIYPLDSPGGWQLIGRTPLRPYDAKRKKVFLYEMGEYIRFCPISEKEYALLEKDINQGVLLQEEWG